MIRAALIERLALALSRLGLAPPPFPAPLFDAYFGAVAARAISAAGELGVYRSLAAAPATPGELALRLDLTAEGADALLVGLATLGLVRVRRDRYELTRTARRWAVERAPTWSAAFGAWAHEVAGALPDALRGAPPTGLHDRPPDDPLWATYQAAMAEVGALTAETIAAALALRTPRRLLDLGGGPGLQAAALVHRHPGLEATVADLPAVARRAPPPGIRYLEADLFADDLGSGYDVVTAHNLLHNFSRDRCLALLARARAVLEPGGTLAVSEVERPPRGRPGTTAATIGSLVFLVTMGTRTWTAAELEELVRTSGFVELRIKRPPAMNGSLVLLARRPDASGERA